MAYNPQNPNGSTTSANSSPVVIASDQSAVAVSGTVTANAGTGSFTVAQSTAANLNATVTGNVTVSQATASNLKVDLSGTAANATAIKVDNSAVTQPVSGSVTVSQGTAANLNATVTGTVAATQSGAWGVGLNAGSNAIGSITNTSFIATQATAASLLNKPYGSATTAAPTYTNGTDNPLSLTTSGALRIDGSGSTQPISGTITANAGTGNFVVTQPTAANLNATVTGTIAATQSGTWSVGLNAGSNAIGSITNTTFAATQATAASLNATVVGTGTFAVQADTELPAAAALADATANPTTPTAGSANVAYNGTTWDRLRTQDAMAGNGANNTVVGVLAANLVATRYNPTALATAAASTSAFDIEGYNTICIGLSTSTTGTIIFEATQDNTNWYSIETFDAVSDVWVTGQSITPTSGKVYYIACSGLRQVRIRVLTTLGATVSHFATVTNGQQVLSAIDSGPAPHNFGYTIVHKDAEYTTAQTGTVIWTPTTGKKFAITNITVSTGGTTAGIVTIFDAISATTTFTAGTTPAIFRGNFVPSATSTPIFVKQFQVPYISTAANNVVHITTSAAMTVYIQIEGYEL